MPADYYAVLKTLGNTVDSKHSSMNIPRTTAVTIDGIATPRPSDWRLAGYD